MRGARSRAKSIHKTNVAGVECAQGSQQEMGPGTLRGGTKSSLLQTGLLTLPGLCLRIPSKTLRPTKRQTEGV